MSNPLTTEATFTTGDLPDDSTGSPSVWKVGVVAGLAAGAVNTGLAATALKVNVSLAVAGEQIPLLGFAQLTFVAALIGIALAAVCARRARHPRTVFVSITIALTALSIIPIIIVDTDTPTRLVLAATHAIGAAAVVGALARRLTR